VITVMTEKNTYQGFLFIVVSHENTYHCFPVNNNDTGEHQAWLPIYDNDTGEHYLQKWQENTKHWFPIYSNDTREHQTWFSIFSIDTCEHPSWFPIQLIEINIGWLVWFGFMVFNATFNNISVISCRPVLLVEDLEKTTDLSQVTRKLYHIMLYTLPWSRF